MLLNQGQKCARTACNNPNAQWYNHSTRMFYCETCAAKLNKIHREEAMKLYGHDLCTLCTCVDGNRTFCERHRDRS